MSNKVSIIIPVYNGKRYIGETLKSCDELNYDDYEVYIIDDHSTDGSYEYIKEVLMPDLNKDVFSIICNSENIGVLRTLNKAVESVNGEYIIFLGQDDLLPSNYLSEIITQMKENSAFVFCNPIIIDGQGNKRYNVIDNLKIARNSRLLKVALAKECIIPSTGLIINAKKFKQIGGFDTKYRNYGEWNLWIRLLEIGEASFCETVNSLYRRHETNMTNGFTKSKIRKDLCKYWNECRSLASRTFKYNLFEKMEILVYRFKVNFKEMIFSFIKR